MFLIDVQFFQHDVHLFVDVLELAGDLFEKIQKPVVIGSIATRRGTGIGSVVIHNDRFTPIRTTIVMLRTETTPLARTHSAHQPPHKPNKENKYRAFAGET